MRTAGLMVALEGVDGSGKTGLAKMLAEKLRELGRDVIATREPGGTPAGTALRQLLLAEQAYDWTPTAELLLMNASRRQHVDELIRPALDSGSIVLCDRFVGSTLAYQGAGRGLSEALILDLHRLAIDDLWPHLTLILDIDPEVALARSKRRLAESLSDESRFEALDLGFHRRVRQSFLDQAAKRPNSYRVISADQSPEAVFAQAFASIQAVI
jgi:dTMP kinase